jgi:hypothetical protein
VIFDDRWTLPFMAFRNLMAMILLHDLAVRYRDEGAVLDSLALSDLGFSQWHSDKKPYFA